MNVLETQIDGQRTRVRERVRAKAKKGIFFETKVETESNIQSSVCYPEVRGDKTMSWVAFGVAALAHAIFFFGFGGKKAAAPVVAASQATEVVLFEAPPVPEEDLLVDAAEIDGERAEAGAGIDVPSLPDLPTTVNLHDFLQVVQMTNLTPRADVAGAKNLSQIPTGFRGTGGSGSGDGLGNLFSLSDLDRAPTPVYRPLPSIPPRLLKVATGVSITVEFVVSTKGEVRDVRVVSSSDRAFDDVAIAAVKTWKFKPGYRQGRTVNVSMSQAIDFKVSGR